MVHKWALQCPGSHSLMASHETVLYKDLRVLWGKVFLRNQFVIISSRLERWKQGTVLRLRSLQELNHVILVMLPTSGLWYADLNLSSTYVTIAMLQLKKSLQHYSVFCYKEQVEDSKLNKILSVYTGSYHAIFGFCMQTMAIQTFSTQPHSISSSNCLHQ